MLETKMVMVSRSSRQHDGRLWSLLPSWLRPHRGISQAKLPLYLGFFEFVHNARKRGKALLSALLECLSIRSPWNPYRASVYYLGWNVNNLLPLLLIPCNPGGKNFLPAVV
jgi:hypothetical protein